MKYVHGGDIYTAAKQWGSPDILDYSSNLNPMGMPLPVQQALHQAVEESWRYPDPRCTRLTQALAQWEQQRPEWIVCGNGAADLIFRLVQAIRPQNALVPAPTFAEYEQALQGVGCQVQRHYLSREKGFVPDETLLERIVPGIEMVFFCNPNNPTGCLSEKGYLTALLERCAKVDTWLVVDECFLDFVPQGEKYSLKEALSRYPKLIILRAFTKIFAMAGVRLGYCISSNTQLLTALQEVGQPWSVSTFAQKAGIAAVKVGMDSDYLAKTHQMVEQQRELLSQSLTNHSFTVFPSAANYLMFHTDRISFHQQLLQRGILIRDCSNYPGLTKGDYRIAVRSKQENLRFLEILNGIFGGADAPSA